MNPAEPVHAVLAPRVNANDEKAQVAHWYVEEGALVRAGQDLVDLATSKATVVLQSEHAGYLARVRAEGEFVRVGEPVALVCSSPEGLKSGLYGEHSRPVGGEGGRGARYSRNAARLAKELGIDLRARSDQGLVTADALKRSVSARRRWEPVSPVKWAEIASFGMDSGHAYRSSVTVQFSGEELYEKLNRSESTGGLLLPLILYELGQLLRRNPLFAAYYEDGRIYYLDQANVAVAVDHGSGLRKVVIKDIDRMTPIEVYRGLADLVRRLRKSKLAVHEISGESIMVTDLSSCHVLHFEPILGAGQSAILAVGGDVRLAGKPITFTMAFDHRVLNGRQVAIFLGELRDKVHPCEFDFSSPKGRKI